MQVGLISDTHGLLRPEALTALAGSDLILHAGDVGGAAILPELSRIAPTHAVRGNIDTGDWADELPGSLTIDVGVFRVHIVHRLADLELDPACDGIAAVIYGHSHKPSIEWRDGVLYCNPGSAGPRRFKLPVAVARLRLEAGTIAPQIVELC